MTAVLTRPKNSLAAFLMVATTIVGVAADTPAASAGETVLCRGKVPTIIGSAADDELVGTRGRDIIHGLGGNDVIYGLGKGDTICGGDGDDLIFGGGGSDRIYGGNGRDELHGGKGNDRLYGRAGSDTLFGGRHADVCVGETESKCEVDYRGPRDEELWRDLVDEHFGDIGQTDNALVIVACESNGNPFAVNPNGKVPKGLWQFIPSTWTWATPFVGWEKEVRFHPEAATETARWLYDWADGRTRQDGSDGQGFDPWVHCRCLLPEYDCVFDASAVGEG